MIILVRKRKYCRQIEIESIRIAKKIENLREIERHKKLFCVKKNAIGRREFIGKKILF